MNGAGREWHNFVKGFSQISLLAQLTDQSISGRFRGSYLGVWWLVLSQVAFAGIAGYIWALIFSRDPGEFVPFIAVSFAVWGFITGAIVDSSATFVTSAGFIKQIPLPLSIFILRQILAHLIYLAVGLGVAIALKLIMSGGLEVSMLWAIPGILLTTFTLTAISTVVAFLGGRFRDITHGLSSLFLVLYVVTPVIYPPEVLKNKGFEAFIHLNPFAGMLEVIREPLIYGRPADVEHYLVISAVGLICSLCAYLVVTRFGRKVVYWL
jgi:ABC-type polysaccharide/polyol phosphate export permease